MSRYILKPPVGAVLNKHHPLAKGLVGAWLFNEGRGKRAYDRSGNGNNATLLANASWSVSTKGTALDSTSAGATLLYSPSIDITGDQVGIVVGLIPNFNPSGSPDTTYFVFDGDRDNVGQFRLMYANTNTWRFRVHASSSLNYNHSGQTGAKEFVQIAAIYDGAEQRIYENERALGSGLANSGNIKSNTGNDRAIGAQGDGSSEPFDGDIVYAYLFDRAPTASEILSLHLDPYQMFRPDPIELWTYEAAGAGSVVPIIMQNLNQFNGGTICAL